VALGLLAVVALLGGAVAVRSAGTGDDGGERSSSPPLTAATTTTLPEATDAELRAAVDEISTEVEDLRGLDFEEPVTVDLASDDEFEQRLLADFDEDADELATAGVLLAAFGLIEPDADVVGAMRELLGGGVVGFYDPETGELVVRGTSLSPYVRVTIAHELTHALDDQHFGLDRPEYDAADDEISYGFSALVEGSASRVERSYREALSDDDRATALAEETELARGVDPSAVPFALVEEIISPYVDGEAFVEALVDDGGQDVLDGAFAEPPTTSEQVLEPDAYLAGEDGVDVAAPAVHAEVLDEGVVGMRTVRAVLAGVLGDAAAGSVASGWGGDRAVIWRDGERSCATMAVEGDRPGDTTSLRVAFETWAEAAPDDRVVRGEGGAPFTVESCAG
jgi:hypothetical protein